MIKQLWFVLVLASAACSGTQETPSPNAQGGSAASSEAGAGGASEQPNFCGYKEELRDVPSGDCDFSGLCQVRVAYYCENKDAATRKKYDCECMDGEYSCTVTEIGLSIDDTCPQP